MKTLYLLFTLCFLFSCTPDDDVPSTPETTTPVEILGEWHLAYYQYAEQRRNPAEICNGNTNLVMNISAVAMQAETPCNYFEATILQQSSDSLQFGFGGLTLSQCNPNTPNCSLDGNQVEEELLKIWLNHENFWNESALMHFTALRYENGVDSLQLNNDNGDFAVYFR